MEVGLAGTDAPEGEAAGAPGVHPADDAMADEGLVTTEVEEPRAEADEEAAVEEPSAEVDQEPAATADDAAAEAIEGSAAEEPSAEVDQEPGATAEGAPAGAIEGSAAAEPPAEVDQEPAAAGEATPAGAGSSPAGPVGPVRASSMDSTTLPDRSRHDAESRRQRHRRSAARLPAVVTPVDIPEDAEGRIDIVVIRAAPDRDEPGLGEPAASAPGGDRVRVLLTMGSGWVAVGGLAALLIVVFVVIELVYR
jgi:ubiquinol-cytochrome c reductase cytochrome c1 subunit